MAGLAHRADDLRGPALGANPEGARLGGGDSVERGGEGGDDGGRIATVEHAAAAEGALAHVGDVEERGDEVVFFDGRNAFEAKIGKFKNAVVPDVQTSHDFVGELESGKYDHLKDKPIVTYCTGGIRCEILSAVMINRGFKEVYQIDGGIVRYGEKFKDQGLWEGSLYIFDDRMVQDFSDEAKVIGVCEGCGGATNEFRNCSHAGCKDLILLCDTCYADPKHLEHKDTHTRGKRHAETVG